MSNFTRLIGKKVYVKLYQTDGEDNICQNLYSADSMLFLCRKIKSDQNVLILCLCISLFLAYLILLTGVDNAQDEVTVKMKHKR